MPKTSQEKKIERTRCILDAAIEVFSLKGYSATTVDEIAEKACVSKGLLYTYFKSKEEIFLSMITHIDEITNREDVLSKFLEQTHDYPPTDRLLNLWDTIMHDWTDEDLSISRLQFEFWLEASKIPVLREKLVARSQQSMNLIQQIITDSTVKVEPSTAEAFGRLWWAQIDGLVGYFVSHGKVPNTAELLQIRLLISSWCHLFFDK